jgi:hypothetical protein
MAYEVLKTIDDMTEPDRALWMVLPIVIRMIPYGNLASRVIASLSGFCSQRAIIRETVTDPIGSEFMPPAARSEGARHAAPPGVLPITNRFRASRTGERGAL